MSPMFTRSAQAVERLAGCCEKIALAALFVMTSLIITQMVGRELFNLGLPSVEELARWSGLCLVYLATPFLFLQGRHVNVDLFQTRLGGGLRKLVDLLIETLTVFFGLAFLIGGYFFMQRAGGFSTPALGMPNLVFYAPVFLGMALSLLAGLVRLARVAAAPAKAVAP